MQLFFAQIIHPNRAILLAEEARHCIKVLRHAVGDEISCIDGTGNMYQARITSIDKTEVAVELLTTHPNWGEPPIDITLAVSPLRLKDRFEWMMEKAVELGVSSIQPLRCQHTDKYKAKFKPERIQTILKTALKQCKRSRLPELKPEVPFAEWINGHSSEISLMGWCEADQPIQEFGAPIGNAKSVTLLIGPEGDFSPEEVKMAQDANWTPISLGETRLRTETAAVYALSAIKVFKAF
ncbi:RsmE family RNA methyltransferase [Pontibacter sp. G13]|uniref:RsmE family RNA methyltransferase n=1 Tax=Pontibacter sp. G13 TaxID=3074898 RepID=UPI00288B7240|nr:RsmE family RNA methyltransferase [Pontibacter sp. G13]WNJ16235.1 RsmE family RNA methyltransferase [Pontibacter sp. G13]